MKQTFLNSTLWVLTASTCLGQTIPYVSDDVAMRAKATMAEYECTDCKTCKFGR